MEKPLPDLILERMEDGEWHNLEKLARTLHATDFKVGISLEFLAQYKFIEIDKDGVNGKLTPDIKAFLEQIKMVQRDEKWKRKVTSHKEAKGGEDTQ
jgi:primase-polymerase (primpol)-like protein